MGTVLEVFRGVIADFVLQSMTPEASLFWTECYLRGYWNSYESPFIPLLSSLCSHSLFPCENHHSLIAGTSDG
jgi:hypothetical protein